MGQSKVIIASLLLGVGIPTLLIGIFLDSRILPLPIVGLAIAIYLLWNVSQDKSLLDKTEESVKKTSSSQN